eukprot:510840_1
MTTFHWLGFVLIPTFIQAQSPTNKTCLSSQSHCSFDCNEQLDWTYSCKSVTIDGRASESLFVSCKDKGCNSATFHCPQTCYIHCIDNYSCQRATVFYNDSDNINHPPNITIKCESDSCDVMNITSYTTSTYDNINKPNGGILNIIVAFTRGPFYVYGNKLDQINMWCNGNKLDQINGMYACNSIEVYGYEINQLNTYCPDSQWYYVDNIDFYCNSNVENSCDFHNCHLDQTTVEYNKIHLNSSLITNPDNFYKIVKIERSDLPFQIYCDFHTHSYFNDWPKDEWFTSIATYNEKLSRFDCTNMYCCPFKNIAYECKTKQCGIKCDNCHGREIDGGEIAETFAVICPSQHKSSQNNASCVDSIIYCPSKANSICSVSCESYGCINTIIMSPVTNNKIILNCKQSNSCTNVQIIGDYASDISVYCDTSNGNAVTNILNGFCNSLEINGRYVTNKVELYCIGNYACNNQTKVYGQYANTVKLFADGLQSMYLGEIHAEHANLLSVSCKNDVSINNLPQQGGTGSCYFTSLYSPASITALFDLQCIGTGCYYLNVYQSALTFINNFNITVNSCNKCNNINNCIDHWNIYCDNSSYSTYTTYFGSHCDASNCNCNLLANNSHYDNVTVDGHGCSQNIITNIPSLPPVIVFNQ